MIDTTTVEMQRGMYVSLYQASQEIYGHAQVSVYDVGGKLRFTTDTLSRADSLPVYWGILKKAYGQDGMTWYRTDPYLALTDARVLMQGAYAIENPGGAGPDTWYWILPGKISIMYSADSIPRRIPSGFWIPICGRFTVPDRTMMRQN